MSFHRFVDLSTSIDTIQHSLYSPELAHDQLFPLYTLYTLYTRYRIQFNMRSSTLIALLPFAFAAPAARSGPAPVLVPRGAKVIEGKYIVKMKDNVSAEARISAISSISAKADHTYTSFNGFSASLTSEELQKLKNDPSVSQTTSFQTTPTSSNISPKVDFIEQDAIVTISATQQDADWGLARLSNQKPGSTSYTYDDSAGAGTCAYIIDTGIYTNHTVRLFASIRA